MRHILPSISIVIVTWNGRAYAIECLDSLRNSSREIVPDIVVVDNSSHDGTPEAIAEQFPTVTLMRASGNLGFAKANNLGMRLSAGDYVCLINSDVVVPPGCLEKMILFMEGNPDIGMLGPKMVSPDGTVGQSVMLLPTVWNSFCCALGLHSLFRNSNLLSGYMMSGFEYDKVSDVEVLTGWFWVVRRSALEQVGGLDEQFFMYGEDIDWCHRFLKAGWRVVFYPEAEALHYGAASSGQAPTRFYIEMRRANLQYFKKHRGRRGELAYGAILWIHELTRVIAYGILYPFRQGRRSILLHKLRRGMACIRWLAGTAPIPGAK